MPQPRKHPRYEIALPVHAKVAQEGNSHTFRATTCNISCEGAAIELHEEQDTMEPLHFLLSTAPSVNLVVELPAAGEKVTVRGTVKWLDIGIVSERECYLRAGIHLGEMSEENTSRWQHLLDEIAESGWRGFTTL